MSAATIAPAGQLPGRAAPPVARRRPLTPVPAGTQPPDGDRAATAPPSRPPGGRPSHPRLRVVPVPVREPFPVDRIRTLDGPVTVGPAQGTLSLTVTQPVSAMTQDSDGGSSEELARHEWVVTFVHAALEVASGVRSPSQLVRWTGLDVHAMLVRRGALAARARGTGGPPLRVRPVVRSIRMSSPAAGAWEVAVVVQTDDTIRAVALRVEELEGRRRVTDLEIG